MIINASSALKTTLVRKCCLLNSSVSLYIYNRASRNNAVYNYNFEDVCFVHNSWIARPVIGSVFSASLLDEDIFHKISGPGSNRWTQSMILTYKHLLGMASGWSRLLNSLRLSFHLMFYLKISKSLKYISFRLSKNFSQAIVSFSSFYWCWEKLALLPCPS